MSSFVPMQYLLRGASCRKLEREQAAARNGLHDLGANSPEPKTEIVGRKDLDMRRSNGQWMPDRVFCNPHNLRFLISLLAISNRI